MNKRDQLEVAKGQDGCSVNYNLTIMSPNQEFTGRNLTNSSKDLVPDDKQIPVCSSSCFSEQMVGSIEPALWNHPRMILEKPRFTGMDAQNVSSTLNSMPWSGPSLISPEVPFLLNHDGIPPHCFPQFPADIGFVERAFRSSCFPGGNFEMKMKNPLSCSESLMNQCSTGGRTAKGGSPVVNLNESELDLMAIDNLRRSREERKVGSGKDSDDAVFPGVNGQEEPSSLEDISEELSAKSLSPKRRKRNPQDAEAGESKESPEGNEAGKNAFKNKQKADQDPNPNATLTVKKNEKQGPLECDPSKGEYIHVRARRGQATNSHSLAERLRREKISERMKLLQDLVPGCNKVTGKAVMLDEIINYVQSLQRQVEFLSMKLSTVIPRIDFITAGPKEIARPGSSSSSPFPQDFPMVYPDPSHQSQPPYISHSHMTFSSSDVFQRRLRSAMPSPNGPTSRGLEQHQVQGVWENELHNVVHMNYGTPDDDAQ